MKKKKLLYLSQCFPLPLDGGGKIKTFNTLKTLAKKFDIFAVFISERTAPREELKEFEKLGIKVKIFQTNIMSQDIKENYLKLIWNYLHLRPHFVYQYRYIPSFKWIKKKIEIWQPEIIHVDHINSAQFLPTKEWLTTNCKKSPKLILENHNLNHVLFFTRFKETTKAIRKLYLLIEGSLNWLYGEINYRRFDHVFSISDSETKYLSRKCKSVFTQKLTYPLQKARKTSIKKYDILFIGYLEWPPNEIAVRWFVEEVMPLINKKISTAKLHVVGHENPKIDDLKKNENIIFHGYQKSINKFVQASKIFVLPFKTGAGVRIKSLTALQNGLAIVSTRLGVNGLHLVENKHYLAAETNQEFANQVVKLLQNKTLRNKFGKEGEKYFLRHHSEKNNQLFLKEYLKCTN